MQTSVKEFMSGDPVSIAPGASALAAYETMLRHGIRHLPVVGPDARVIGVITADDLAAALALPLRPRRALEAPERRAALEWAVGELMTHAPETLTRDATLAEAAERMAEGRFGCLPIVDESGRLEGLLSETDLLHAFVSMLTNQGLRDREKPDALAELVAQLERERSRIVERFDRQQAVDRDTISDLHEHPLDDLDRGAELSEVQLTDALAGLAARRLAALDRALDHAAQGRLSICDACSGPISLPRLRALPGATLCIDCARARESGKG